MKFQLATVELASRQIETLSPFALLLPLSPPHDGSRKRRPQTGGQLYSQPEWPTQGGRLI